MNSHHSRIPAFDILRIIACILVVLIHVSAQWTDASASRGTAALAFSLGCNMLAFSSLPIFIMISGALYLSPRQNSSPVIKPASSISPRGADTHRMLRRSMHFVLLYFIWKLFYLLEDCIMEPELLAREGFKKHVILALFQTEGKYHLWYLPMLAVLLFLTPLICEGLQKKSVRRMYLIPFFILAILLPTAFQFEFPFKYLLMDFRNLFDLSYFVGYLGFFILGYHLWCACSESSGDGSLWTRLREKSVRAGMNRSDMDILKKADSVRKQDSVRKADSSLQTKIIGMLILLAAILTWIMGLIHAIRRTLADGVTFYGLSTPFALHSLLFAAAIFVLAISQDNGDSPSCLVPHDNGDGPSCLVSASSHRSAIRQLFSNATFGIYFVHPFILDLLTKIRFLSLLHSPFYGIPVLLAATLALSFLLTEILLHIPFVRKLAK